jgi:hypothetical protein
MTYGRADTLFYILSRVLEASGPLSEAYRERLPEIDPDTGKTRAEELLAAAEAAAWSGTAEGKQIAELLPQFRQVVDRIKRKPQT